jgi:hypothetical protein
LNTLLLLVAVAAVFHEAVGVVLAVFCLALLRFLLEQLIRLQSAPEVLLALVLEQQQTEQIHPLVF